MLHTHTHAHTYTHTHTTNTHAHTHTHKLTSAVRTWDVTFLMACSLSVSETRKR